MERCACDPSNPTVILYFIVLFVIFTDDLSLYYIFAYQVLAYFFPIESQPYNDKPYLIHCYLYGTQNSAWPIVGAQ